MLDSEQNTTIDVASLHKLRPEIESSLKTLEHQLGDFIDDSTTSDVLSESVEALEQVQSVLLLINLDGSKELTTALIDALSHLVKTADNTQRELIYSISEGVMTLNRYIEFVLLRERIYPKLLLTAINKIRLNLKQPLLGESAFEQPSQLASQAANAFKPVAVMGSASKLLQKTFRQGLNAAIKNKDVTPKPAVLSNIKLMQLACQHVNEQVGGKFWEVAFAAVESIEKALPLTASRQRALVFLETQFANASNALDEKRFADLVSMAASRSHEKGTRLRHEMQLDTLDDTEYSEMHSFMFGPNRDVVDTVNELIQEEINATKDMVDTEARKEKPDPENCQKIAFALRDLSLRLYLLGLKTAAEKVMEQAKVVSGWQSANPEQFESLLSALLYAENATILMAKSHTPGLVSLPLNNTGISLHQLDTAFEELVKESRSTLANAVSSITSYMNSADKDKLHLANLATMLSSVGGAMLFVDVSRGHKLLNHAAKYVAERIKSPEEFDDKTLAKLADIIMSADFYLESIELKQPSGDKPLIIGAQSLKSLLSAA